MQRQAKAPTFTGAAENFTGDVYVDMIVSGGEAGLTIGSVHFTPGAHTAWHSHAAGQTLHVTEGLGLVVTAEEVIVLRPGDTVWTPPGQRHWHGAAPDHLMSHLAISAAVDPASGAATWWQEHVSDAEYLAAAKEI